MKSDNLCRTFGMLVAIFLITLGSGQADLRAQPTLSLIVEPEDQALKCGVRLQGAYENVSLIVTATRSGFPENADVQYRFFITRDGFERGVDETAYTAIESADPTLVVKTGQLIAWLNFGMIGITVEANDQLGNYAHHSMSFRINQPFVYLRNKKSRFNCHRDSEGQIASGLYTNPTNASRKIVFEDTHLDSLYKSQTESNGLYLNKNPSIHGFSLMRFSRNSRSVRSRFSYQRIYQINRAYKTLAPFDRGVIVRRFRTYINAYDVYTVDDCGRMTPVATAMLEKTTPFYHLVLVDGEVTEFADAIAESTLAKTFDNCPDDIDAGKRLFMKFDDSDK